MGHLKVTGRLHFLSMSGGFLKSCMSLVTPFEPVVSLFLSLELASINLYSCFLAFPTKGTFLSKRGTTGTASGGKTRVQIDRLHQI
jgi:hypothetical protein